MAITKTEVQIEWTGPADSVSVSAGGVQTSLEWNPDATAVEEAYELKADNAGTPAAGDTVDFYLLQTLGDPDGASADEFPAGVTDGLFIARIDTNAVDPNIQTIVGFPSTYKGGKLHVKSNAASNSIIVSATRYEMRSS